MVSGKNWRYERWRWQTFGITWLAYFGFYLTRKSFSVAKIGIDQDPTTNISLSQMAWVDGAYLIAYAVGQFVWGMTADKVGTRRVVLCGMFGSVAAAAAMGASSVTLALGILFCLQGVCQSTGWAPLTMNIGNFFSRNERGTVMGFWCTNFAMGGLVASAYAGYWGDRLGWRFAFFVPAATLLVIWFLLLLLQRNRPQDLGLPPIEQYHQQQTPEHKGEAPQPETPQLEPEGSWKTLFTVISNPTILALGAVYFLLKPTRYAILFWGPKYINSKLGTNMTESGIIGGLFEAAGIVSILLAGWISDRVFNREGCRCASFACSCSV
ncbi:MAG: MFS transporter [Planctomycetota bacterium]|nr:MFS transporter [Planctomycetota bacterium]